MAKLKFRNVNKIYPNNVQAVFDFNLDVDDKEFVVFVGPSGCGKSTTLRMIAGLEEISSGEIYIDDKLINEVPPVNRHIAMVFQNYALYPHMTVFDNMAFSLKLRKRNFPVIDVDVDNPDYIKRYNELCEAMEEETKAGIAKIKEDKNRKHKQNVKARVKEYVFKQRNLLVVKTKELQSEFSKQRFTYDDELVAKLESEYKELLANENKNQDELNKKKAEIEEAYSKEVKPLMVYRHYNHDEIVEKVSKAAETLGLTPYLKRKPAALSGGQRQRVALGRAIVRNPRVFLMDEPLSNLDAKLRVQMRSEITKIHKAVGATTIYVTHDQTEAMTMATKIVCMKDGYIQQIGSPKELFNTPENIFVASFIGSPATNLVNGKFDGKSFYVPDTDFTLKLSKEQIALLKDYKDKDVVLGVRPEDVYLSDDSNIKNPSNVISLKCDISELLGRELIVYNPVGKDKIIAKINTRDDIVGGCVEKYVIDLDRIHFFDPETTKRIR